MNNKPLLAAVFAAGLLGLGTAAQAQYGAVVTVAPPAPRYEVVPAPRAGWVWAPGHWEWQGNRHVWMQGTWLRERSGYEYRAPRWVQRGNGEWILVGNNWERRGPYGDRDGDGIPNRYDNSRNRYSPNADLDRDGVANRRDLDRDGDGIRNNRDRFPNDRRRG